MHHSTGIWERHLNGQSGTIPIRLCRFYPKKCSGNFDCGEYGKDVLEAYEQAGEIAPKLLRRFGITNENRQTLTLGMTMSKLVNPKKYRLAGTL